MSKFSDNLTSEEIKGVGRLLVKPLVLPGVVSFHISVLSGSRHDAKFAGLLPELAAKSAREATQKLSRSDLASYLEERAITMSVVVDTMRTTQSVSAPKGELVRALAAASDVLREPRFAQEDFEMVKSIKLNRLREALVDTDARAEERVWRTLFDKSHPNCGVDIGEQINIVEKITLEDVKKYWSDNVGANDTVLVATGDVEGGKLSSLARKCLSGWEDKAISSVKVRGKFAKNQPPNLLIEKLLQKTSVDTIIALPIDIDIWSREYQALNLGLRAFGGHGFTSRLMSIVRDKHGLTYGTYANLRGLSRGDSGALFVTGSFAPTLYSKGMSMTQELLEKFMARGITKAELEMHRANLIGSTAVSLSQSGGVLKTLRTIAEEKRPVTEVEDTLDIVRSLSLAEVNAAIKKNLDLSRMIKVAAGSI